MSRKEIALTAILTLGLIAGQLIKLPLNGLNGVSLIDLVIFLLVLFGLLTKGIFFSIFPKYLITLSLFFILGGLFLLLSPLHLSFNQIIISALYPVKYLLYILFALEIVNKKLPLTKTALIQTLVISSTIFSSLGLLQLIFIPNLAFLAPLGWDPHYFRTASTLLDPNFLGAYLTLALILLLEEKSLKLSTRKRIIVFSINFLALLTTFSRSAALAFSSGVIIFSFLKKSKKLFLLSLLLISLFGITYLIYRQEISIPRNISRSQSATYRLSSYQEGLEIFKTSPVFGIGFNSYRFALEKYHLADEATIQSRGGTSNDFSLLFVLATTGVAGEILFLAFIALVIKLAIKNFSQKPLSKIYLAYLIALLLESTFINSLFYSWIFLWIIIIPSLLISDTPKEVS